MVIRMEMMIMMFLYIYIYIFQICLRLLVTLGTLACSATGANYVKRLATDLGVCGSVSALGKAGEKVQACAAQLGALLASK